MVLGASFVAQGQNFEFGYGIGLNFTTLDVVDSTAGVRDSVYGNTFSIEAASSPGYSFMAYGMYHITENWAVRVTAGGDWTSGTISLGREGIGGNLRRDEEQFFEGWFHLAPGIVYSFDIIPTLMSVSAGMDVSFGLAATHLINELPLADSISVRRDYYHLTSVNTVQSGFNIYVRPHVQFNLIRRSGRKWTVNVQYDQALLPYYTGRSTNLTFFDPNTLESVLDSGYSVESSSSRWTVTLGAELPWGQQHRKRPRRPGWNF